MKYWAASSLLVLELNIVEILEVMLMNSLEFMFQSVFSISLPPELQMFSFFCVLIKRFSSWICCYWKLRSGGRISGGGMLLPRFPSDRQSHEIQVRVVSRLKQTQPLTPLSTVCRLLMISFNVQYSIAFRISSSTAAARNCLYPNPQFSSMEWIQSRSNLPAKKPSTSIIVLSLVRAVVANYSDTIPAGNLQNCWSINAKQLPLERTSGSMTNLNNSLYSSPYSLSATCLKEAEMQATTRTSTKVMEREDTNIFQRSFIQTIIHRHKSIIPDPIQTYRNIFNISCISEMASQAYMANMNLKKQKEAEQLWRKIGEHDKLLGLAQLHDKIKQVQSMRRNNHEFMEETHGNYQVLRKDIKDLIRQQNVDKKKR